MRKTLYQLSNNLIDNAKDRALDWVNVYEIMNKPTMSVHPNIDIRYCAELLTHFGLSRCPVIDSGNIVGVVSISISIGISIKRHSNLHHKKIYSDKILWLKQFN